jgi:hypothetical protein
LRSGTSGFSSTIERGSGRGTCGTCTSPAPSRPREEAEEEEPELRTDTERPVVRPDSACDSRPDTERRDREEREEGEDGDDAEPAPVPRALPVRELPPDPAVFRPPPATPVGGEATRPEGDTTGARPQVSQYSSPPPTSSYDPPQPGRWHLSGG